MSTRTRLASVVLLLLLGPSPSDGADPKLDEVLKAEVERVRQWGLDSALIGLVRAQNAKKVPLSRLRSLDIGWVMNPERDIQLHRLMNNDCAKRLKVLDRGDAMYRESFVMDDQGALVCTTHETTDYWQGDEEKWLRAFNEAHGAVFVADPERDESTKTVLVQVNVPVMDGNVAIGVITAGLDYAELQRKAREK